MLNEPELDEITIQNDVDHQQLNAEQHEIIACLQTEFHERTGALKAQHQEALRERDEKLERWKKVHQKTLNELRHENAGLKKSLKDRGAKIEKFGRLAKVAKRALKDFAVVEGMEEESAIFIDE
ncbi:hypothetical protein EJ03DRAFT_351374 [Teratosphaeria nubilosa]|uniref:Uncharacterized protein n=1 Tax=Teratosphaeria nubilosa TaxID=161662 RepID=A0A6G1LA31_9PEZI|nr:hypothetical protein EJ03DRAFT_351374 [Teratosphaeria nubilosa]